MYGISVRHNDLVLADEHAAVAFPADVAAEVAAEAPIIAACKADPLSLDDLKRLYMAR